MTDGYGLAERAIQGRIDARAGYWLSRVGDSDARSVAELRERKWLGYHNRHYRKRARRVRAAILLAMVMKW